ncbi:flagellar type III secretion system protein FlhB [Litoreibacter sp.]|nr:flagellar type III secretion system protein FlhB [Litoreibacter sp.]
MAEEDAAEKSFEATPQKLEQARKRGEFAKSSDLTAAASYLGLILAILIVGPQSVERLASVASELIASSDRISAQGFGVSGSPFLGELLSEILVSLIGFFAVPALIVVLVLTVERAWVFAPEKLMPKLSRISIISGAKNKFGANGLFEFGKSAFKLIFVSGLLYWFAVGNFETLMLSVALVPGQTLQTMIDLMSEFLLLVFAMSLFVGGVDYFWQVASHLRKNRMTRQEVEDESKSNEGDPHHKQARRQRGYEIAMNQMMAEVPKADVILVNPTHYAVALKWDRASLGAPICLAKGVDEIAARIREVAQEANIAIHSDPPTTRAVYASVELGQQILPEHYRAVAVAIRFAEAAKRKAGKA